MSQCVAVELKRRDYVYVMAPADYEMSGCPHCGCNECQWSEFVHRCWCPKCKVDFEPECAGVFDGPIMVELCGMLGIVFDSFDLTTQQMVPFEAPTWPLSPENPNAKVREE